VSETSTADKKFQKELNSGTAVLVQLSVLGSASGPMYGYQIAKQIESRHIESGGKQTPMMKQGAFYPVLRSLEESGLLQSQVEPSVSSPPRRYYRITYAGHQTLARWKDLWERTKGFVDNMLQGVSHDKEH